MKNKLIYVEWCDAVTNSEWFEREEAIQWAEEYSDWTICECGWVIKDTKEMLVIASGWNKDQDKFVNLHKIPKPWIKVRKTLNSATQDKLTK